jgi:hypothetical protein
VANIMELEWLGRSQPREENEPVRAPPPRGSRARNAKGDKAMPEVNPQLDAELIAGFLARRLASENALVERLQPLFRGVIRRNFPSLWLWSEELQQAAFVKLCVLRNEHPERVEPPLDELAVKLVDTPARVMLRAERIPRQSVSLKEFDGISPPDQQARTHLRDLLDLVISKLNPKHASTLLIHAAHETGDGPPLREVLGITQDGAKRKLLDAQDALLTLSRNEVDDG